MQTRRATLSLAVLAAFSYCSNAQDTLESVQRELAEKWSGVQSFSATMRVKADVARSGISAKTDLTGPIVLERTDDGRARYRSELEGKVKGGPFGILRFRLRMLTVSDGETVYAESRIRNKVSVLKTRPQQKPDSSPGGGGERLEAARQKHDLRLLPSGTLGGRPVYVIEGRPKADAASEMPEVARVLMYFDRETGIQLHIAALDKKDKPLTELSFTDVRLNPAVSPSIFRYTVPEGAEVVDKTQESGAN